MERLYLYYLESNQRSAALPIKYYIQIKKSIVLQREEIERIEKQKYRIVETRIRDLVSYVVEYRTFNYIIFRTWKPIVMCDTFDECVKKIDRLVSLKISQF